MHGDLTPDLQRQLREFDFLAAKLHSHLAEARLDITIKKALNRQTIQLGTDLMASLKAVQARFEPSEIMYSRAINIVLRTYEACLNRLANHLTIAISSPPTFKKMLKDIYEDLTKHQAWLEDTTVRLLKMPTLSNKDRARSLQTDMNNLHETLDRIEKSVGGEGQ